MSVEKGSAFLLKIGNGDVPLTYATIAGLRTTQLQVSGEAVNVTNKDSGGWRELLSGAGVRAVSVSAAGEAESAVMAFRSGSGTKPDILAVDGRKAGHATQPPPMAVTSSTTSPSLTGVSG